MIWILVAVAEFIIDQAAKALINNNLMMHESRIIIPGFFNLTRVTNTGAAWSFLSDHTWILTLASEMLILLLVILFRNNRDNMLRAGICIVIGGAAGNLFDRIVFGRVTDYLDFWIFGYDFPVFNAADVFVVCGTVFLAIYVLFARNLDYDVSKPAFNVRDEG